MKRFPVLMSAAERRKYPDCPESVAWAWLAPHDGQARANHGGQNLEGLAARGGLGPDEMVCVLQNRPWSRADMREAVDYLKALCADEDMVTCRGCGKPLDPANFGGAGNIADGCPCNSPRGVNHGLVPAATCTCPECDPEQTGSVRQADAPAISANPAGK